MQNLRHSLQFRLILAFTAVILLTIGSVFVILWQAATGEVREFSQRVEGMVSGRIHFIVSDYYFTYQTWDGVAPLISKLAEQFKYRIILADAGGRVIADSDNSSIEGVDSDRFSTRSIALRKYGSPDELRPEERKPLSAMPLPTPSLLLPSGPGRPNPPDLPAPDTSQSGVAGVLYLMPLTQSEVSLTALQLVTNQIGKYFAIGALMAVVAAIVLTYFLSRRILAPVRQLTVAAGQLGKGDFSQRVKVDEKSEIGDLADTFNLMAADLERDEKLRRDLVADVAHELRSPLTNVRGYLEAIRDGVMEPDEKTINTIYDETMLLSRLVHDLQDLSLAESGQLKLFCQPENVDDLITQAVSAMTAKYAARKISLTVEMEEGLPRVMIDLQRIRQVLLNLLTNALTHTPEGGRVTVSASQAGQFVAISVADTGEGIPPEELPLIFERFHRVDRSRARATGGSGLGLTIARYFVEAHKGTITVESEPGRGSTFTFTLPVSQG